MSIHYTKATEILVEGFFHDYLRLEGVTDICYNGASDGENVMYCLFQNGKWEKKPTSITYEDALALAESVAASRDQEINVSSPILSADLPNGERIQFNIPPSVNKGICAISIRIPSKINFSMNDYAEQGMFDVVKQSTSHLSNTEKELIRLYESKEYDKFLSAATKAKQTIVFAGRTGSGKTTFAKTLINEIPTDERLISIEDTKEIVFHNHKNSLNLYYPSNADANSKLNSSVLLKSCLRQIPDRVLLTEMRDAAAYYNFIEVVKSGHSGSITSMHAGSVKEAFSKLVGMYLSYDAAKGMPYELVEDEIRDLIDIVVCLDRHPDTGKRYINDIYFKKVDYVK